MDDLLVRLDMGTQVPEFELRQEAATEIRRLRAIAKNRPNFVIGNTVDHSFVVKLRPNLWLSDDPYSEPPTTVALFSAKRFGSEGDANAEISEFLTSEFPSLEIQELEFTWEAVGRPVHTIAATAPRRQK